MIREERRPPANPIKSQGNRARTWINGLSMASTSSLMPLASW